MENWPHDEETPPESVDPPDEPCCRSRSPHGENATPTDPPREYFQRLEAQRLPYTEKVQLWFNQQAQDAGGSGESLAPSEQPVEDVNRLLVSRQIAAENAVENQLSPGYQERMEDRRMRSAEIVHRWFDNQQEPPRAHGGGHAPSLQSQKAVDYTDPHNIARRRDVEDRQRRFLPRQERAKYTQQHLEILNYVFAKKRYPTLAQQCVLAQRLGLKPHQIKIWFQNRRRKPSSNRPQAPSPTGHVDESIMISIYREMVEEGGSGSELHPKKIAVRKSASEHHTGRGDYVERLSPSTGPPHRLPQFDPFMMPDPAVHGHSSRSSPPAAPFLNPVRRESQSNEIRAPPDSPRTQSLTQSPAKPGTSRVFQFPESSLVLPRPQIPSPAHSSTDSRQHIAQIGFQPIHRPYRLPSSPAHSGHPSQYFPRMPHTVHYGAPSGGPPVQQLFKPIAQRAPHPGYVQQPADPNTPTESSVHYTQQIQVTPEEYQPRPPSTQGTPHPFMGLLEGGYPLRPVVPYQGLLQIAPRPSTPQEVAESQSLGHHLPDLFTGVLRPRIMQHDARSKYLQEQATVEPAVTSCQEQSTSEATNVRRILGESTNLPSTEPAQKSHVSSTSNEPSEPNRASIRSGTNTPRDEVDAVVPSPSVSLHIGDSESAKDSVFKSDAEASSDRNLDAPNPADSKQNSPTSAAGGTASGADHAVKQSAVVQPFSHRQEVSQTERPHEQSEKSTSMLHVSIPEPQLAMPRDMMHYPQPIVFNSMIFPPGANVPQMSGTYQGTEGQLPYGGAYMMHPYMMQGAYGQPGMQANPGRFLGPRPTAQQEAQFMSSSSGTPAHSHDIPKGAGYPAQQAGSSPADGSQKQKGSD